MPRPKKKTTTDKTSGSEPDKTSSPKKIHDFKLELPATVELKPCDLKLAEGYEFQEKGRFWRDGQELVCVRLLSKHM